MKSIGISFATRLLFCVVAWGLTSSARLHAADAKPTDEDQVTVITSDSLLFDYGKKFAFFKGNVVAVDPGMKLTGDEMTVYFDETDEVEKLVVKGNVVIEMNEMNSRSQSCVYEISTGKISLEGNPQVTRGRSILQAETIDYFRFENRLKAEPRARVILFQGDNAAGKQLN